jgi:ribosome recycling factor
VIDETLFEAEEKMEKAVHVARDELGSLRTGRASPNSFARMVVDYYGAPTPIPQLASVSGRADQ